MTVAERKVQDLERRTAELESANVSLRDRNGRLLKAHHVMTGLLERIANRFYGDSGPSIVEIVQVLDAAKGGAG